MIKDKNNQPVVLVVGQNVDEYGFVKNWLESKDYSTRETADVFEVLDEVSDFTVRRCPDVFMLQVNCQSAEFDEINDLIQTFSDCSNILVAQVSGEERILLGESSAQKFVKTEADLNALMSASSRAAVA